MLTKVGSVRKRTYVRHMGFARDPLGVLLLDLIVENGRLRTLLAEARATARHWEVEAVLRATTTAGRLSADVVAGRQLARAVIQVLEAETSAPPELARAVNRYCEFASPLE